MLYEEETAYYLSSWLCIVSVRSFLGDSAWCRAGQKTKLPAVLSALQDLLGVLEQQEVKALGTSQAGLKIQPFFPVGTSSICLSRYVCIFLQGFLGRYVGQECRGGPRHGLSSVTCNSPSLFPRRPRSLFFWLLSSHRQQ